MDRAVTFRRVFHLVSPAFLSYYILPDQITPNIGRLSLTLLFIGTAGCVEIARIALGVKLFGMRPYEGQRVSAYAQGMVGLVYGLFVIRDPRIVVPVFLGMAWIDPLAAYCRTHGHSRIIPTGTYLGVFVAAELLMRSFSVPYTLLYGAVATAAAVLAEGPKIPQVDDDLLMQVIPMTVLYGLVAWLGSGL